MDKVFKIIIIFEIILFSIFLMGYFFYDDYNRINRQVDCEIEAIPLSLREINVVDIGGRNITLMSGGKEDLNS
jgi:hypothetical protein